MVGQMDLRFRQQSVGETTYLVLDIDESFEVDFFAMQMMSHNRMTHIVQAQIMQVDERKQIQFNITGLVKLNNKIAVPKSKKEVLGMFGSIVNAFEEVDAYMLDMNHLLLDWEYVYMDGKENCMLMYLPFTRFSSKDKIVFLQEIVSRIQPDYQEKDPYLFDILNAFSRGAICKLSDFREVIKKCAGTPERGYKEKVTEERAESDSGIVVSKAAKAGAKTVQEEIKKAEKKSPAVSKIPVINIPGRDPGSKEVPHVPSKEPEEKKGRRSFFKREIRKETEKKQKAEEFEIPRHEEQKQDGMYESYEHTVIMRDPMDKAVKGGETVILNQSDIPAGTSARLVRRQTGAVYVIDTDRLVIGSGTTADVCISANNAISRNHAVISCVEGSFYMEDNHSKNGSFVNGRRLEPGVREPLYAGMTLRFANEDFEFLKD